MKRGGGLLLAAGVSLLPAAFFWLVPAGYNMTALCFLGLALILAACGLLRRWGSKTAKALGIALSCLLAAGLALFLLLEIPILADMPSDEDTSADYAVVFGAAVYGKTPSLSLRERMEAALSWLEEHPEGKAVVSGGQGPREDITEAQAMFVWLTAHGVAPDRILLEERATSSYENIAFSLAVIAADGGDPTGRVALVSSEYHLHRLRYMGRALGFEPVGVAAHTGHISLAANYAVREAFAMAKCRIFGIE